MSHLRFIAILHFKVLKIKPKTATGCNQTCQTDEEFCNLLYYDYALNWYFCALITVCICANSFLIKAS
ncbi:MAG TPA: hypothetical protein DEA94_01070 [Rhodobacteraceae bacterium]|nr:hypothetical protein [Paracoccaceae bacterium]